MQFQTQLALNFFTVLILSVSGAKGQRHWDTNLEDSLSVIEEFSSPSPFSCLEEEVRLTAYQKMCLKKNLPKTKVEVRGLTSSLCRIFPPMLQISKRRYDLSRVNGSFEIILKLHLTYRGRISNEKATREKTTAALLCAKKLFERHGLDLKVIFVDKKSESHHRIKLYDEFSGRGRSKVWSPKSWGHQITPQDSIIVRVEREKSDESYCSFIAHEILHLLGLPDTYPDKLCPDRQIEPKESIMHSSFGDSHNLHISPEHIKQILKPLCR